MAKPWFTSDDLIAAVKRKISFPISQNTFSEADILAFANEEMFIAQVPSVLQYHEEYFVFRKSTPLVPNISRYTIPNRAIGMKLRDLMWSDASGNFFEMTRISASDKAFFQRNIGANQAIHKFYLEGNDVVLTPSVVGGVTGSLNFFIFLRPNQLVANSRAATVQSFNNYVTVNNATLVVGNTVTIQTNTNSSTPSIYTFKAVSVVLDATKEFLIGGSSNATAVNLANLINAQVANQNASVATGTGNITLVGSDITVIITVDASSGGITTTNNSIVSINFDQLPSTWTDPFSNVTTPLYSQNGLVDFLQTEPGHKTYAYDIRILSISGTTATFDKDSLMTMYSNGYNYIPKIINLQVGDYICLANESIIPQIPPDLHNVLAERTAARILAAIGDQAGLAIANQKIAEMELRQGNVLDQRVEGAPEKITARHSLLRYGKMGVRRRM